MKGDFPEVVMKRLMRKYGDYKEELLLYTNPTELLVATMLSPQCTDKQVNATTKHLFKKFKTFEDYASSDINALRKELSGINYYKTKAMHIKEAAQMILKTHHGRLPRTIKGLMTLPGVGRKIANVVLTNGFGITEGIAVDTHAIVVANRLKLTRTRKPEKIEKDLMKKIPKKYWKSASNMFVAVGRDACKATGKECYHCVLKDICPSSNVKFVGAEKGV